MTKQEIVASLSPKYYKIPEPSFMEEKDGIKIYRILPWVKTAENLVRNDLAFCVENEGQPTESAYWTGGNPAVIPEENFTQKANAFIKAKITDGTIKFGYLVSANNELGVGLGVAITPANAKKDVLLKEVSGIISITIL